MATLHELETSWSYDDVRRANAWLDMMDDIEAQQSEDARANK
jgi:hypothetical protein